MSAQAINDTTPLLTQVPRSFEKACSGDGRNNGETTPSAQYFPSLKFTQTRIYGGRRVPQCIAHRGFKAIHPENTMNAFKGAIEEGPADAIETDIHLTKDDVVVLSHDPDLKRCFGRTERVIDCDWDYISSLRTLRKPHVPMPRLKDLLKYISQPSLQHVWILLDIKLDNDAEKVMRLIAETLASVDPGNRSWQSRVVLGIWAAKYLSLCVKYLEGFPVAFIGFSIHYARQFFKVPHVGFNMFAKLLIGPIGNKFIADVQKQNRALYAWTVNDTATMRWAIEKKLDGVITDDPKTFNDVCLQHQGQEIHLSVSTFLHSLWLHFLVALFSIPLKHRFPGSVDTFLRDQKSNFKAIQATQ